MSEKYVVELEFKRNGDFGTEIVANKIRKAERGLEAFLRGWGKLGDTVAPVGAAIDGVARSVARIGVTGAAIGGAAFLAGATYGVTNLNNELEKAQIGLGVIFHAGGVASSVPAGLERAGSVVAQMRLDAQKLPGEFSELQNIFTMGATPAFRAGASIDQFRELSAKAMVAGKVAMMDMNQVARENVLLLEGRAGSHNTFGSRLGLTGEHAQKFNALSADKRFEEYSRLLSKWEGGLTAFETSFDAQSSTLVDHVKNFSRTATEPLFQSVKQAMAEANSWFFNNQDEIENYATTIGYAVRDAFLEGKRIVQEYGPLVLNFAETAYQRFMLMWTDAEPYVAAFADYFKEALADPNGTIDKLILLAELWAGMKIAGAVVGVGGAALGAAQGAGGVLGALGVGGGAAAAGAGGAGAAGGVAAAGGLALGAAFIAALGGATAALWQFTELQDEIHDQNKANFRAKAEAAQRELQQMADAGMAEWEIQQRRNEMHETFIARGQNMADNMLEVSYAAAQAAGSLSQIAWGMEGSNTHKKFLEDTAPDWLKLMNKPGSQAVAPQPERSAESGKHKSKGGGGGSIQKVEIVVTSNQHPSRIAREVVGELGKLQRMSGTSPHVENYSALEDNS